MAGMRYTGCQHYINPALVAWKSVLAISLNTPERIEAVQEHETRISRHTFKMPKNDKAGCTFNPDLLKN